MYYYIVDPKNLSQRDFERVQNQLYSSVSAYRVAGEVVRVTGLRTINQLVETALSHEAKTIVAVGSDDTLNDVINAVGEREIVVGFVPIVETEVGKILGIKDIDQAAKTLGGRRIAELDLGSVNNTRFISKLSFGLSPQNRGLKSLFHLPNFDIRFSADNQYRASMKAIGGIISNSSNPTSSIFDIALLSQLSKWNTFKYRSDILNERFEKIPGSSIIHAKKIEISTPEGLPLRSGGRIIAKTPAVIEVLPKALKIIVGKDRRF